MDCNQIRQDLLDRDWTTADLAAARILLNHLDHCPECAEVVGQYDGIRATLAAEEHTPAPAPAGGWMAFEDRLEGGIAAPAHAHWWRLPLAMAASIALLLTGWGLAMIAHSIGANGTNPTNGVGLVAAQPPPGLRFTPKDASDRALAFREVSEVFDGRAQWVMVSDRGSDVGVAQRPLAPAGRVILVRLALSHDGQPAATSDIAIIPGQSADLRVPLDAERSIRYRIGTSGVDASRLSLFAELTDAAGAAGEPIAALATQLDLAPGQTANAGEMNTVSGPYRLSVAFAQADLTNGTPQ